MKKEFEEITNHLYDMSEESGNIGWLTRYDITWNWDNVHAWVCNLMENWEENLACEVNAGSPLTLVNDNDSDIVAINNDGETFTLMEAYYLFEDSMYNSIAIIEESRYDW